MPDTFQSLAILLVALLPGALYVWSFERQVGQWGVGLADRFLRFVGWTAIFQAALAPVTYWFWWTKWPVVRDVGLPTWWMWFAAMAYVVAPLVIGTAVGKGARTSSTWSKWFTGPNPAPRAWDYLFTSGKSGWVRVRLRSGVWLGGAYAKGTGKTLTSYAAGYPDAQDLLLTPVTLVDPDSGEFRFTEDDKPAVRDGALLMRWDEIEYLEFIDLSGDSHVDT